jgi:hypothetical protein
MPGGTITTVENGNAVPDRTAIPAAHAVSQRGAEPFASPLKGQSAMSTLKARTGSKRRKLTDAERLARKRAASREQYAFIKAHPELYGDLLAERRQWWADLKTKNPGRYEAKLAQQREWRRRSSELKRARLAELRLAMGHIKVAASVQFVPREAVSEAFKSWEAAKAIRARLLKAYKFTLADLHNTARRYADLAACRRHVLEEVKRANQHWPL